MSSLHIDITVDCENREREVQLIRSVLDGIKATAFPSVTNVSEINLTRFTVSTSNRVYKCQANNDVAFLRIFGEVTSLFVDREAELEFSRQYSGTLSATLFCTFNNGYVESFIGGDNIELETMREPWFAVKLAKKIANWHSTSICPQDLSKHQGIFATLHKWIEVGKTIIPEAVLAPAQEEVSHIEQLIMNDYNDGATLPDLALCHNDVNFGNVLYDKNAREEDQLFLIDTEYAGYNYREFDIGNHFVEYGGLILDFPKYPSRDVRRKFIIDYLTELKLNTSNEDLLNIPTMEEGSINKMLVMCERFAQVSHLLWYIWGLCFHYRNKNGGPNEGFDYLDYANKRFGEYLRRKTECREEIYAVC